VTAIAAGFHPGQVVIQIEVDGTGNMAGLIGMQTVFRVGQLEAAVENDVVSGSSACNCAGLMRVVYIGFS
jgi:hypothetical protein